MKSLNRRDFLISSGTSLSLAAFGGNQAKGKQLKSSADINKSPEPDFGIRVVAPSTAAVGQEFELKVKVLVKPAFMQSNAFVTEIPSVKSGAISPRGITYMNNVHANFKGTLEIESDDSYAGPSRLSFTETKGPYEHDRRAIRFVGGLKFKQAGIHYITLKDPKTGTVQKSNPVCVTEKKPAENLYWGDIHSHGILGDGIRFPEELHYFARDEGLLDIYSYSEHSEYYLTEHMWKYMKDVTNSFNEDGRFVTIIAHEWTHRHLGHRNLYFPSDDPPFIRSTDKAYSTLDKLYEFARANNAIAIPHHPANKVIGVKWHLGHDPKVERLVEIYSSWGNSERSSDAGNPFPIHPTMLGGEQKGQHVADALAMGRKFGIIASSDSHDGRPGDQLMNLQNAVKAYPKLWRGGLVGVWAKELTRKSIFEALWNRRVYGTTGARIILRFKINDEPMGSEIRTSGRINIRIEAQSEVPIAKIEIVKDGKDHLCHEPDSEQVDYKTQETVSDDVCFYARLTLQDGQMAWSSPIWVTTV